MSAPTRQEAEALCPACRDPYLLAGHVCDAILAALVAAYERGKRDERIDLMTAYASERLAWIAGRDAAAKVLSRARLRWQRNAGSDCAETVRRVLHDSEDEIRALEPPGGGE